MIETSENCVGSFYRRNWEFVTRSQVSHQEAWMMYVYRARGSPACMSNDTAPYRVHPRLAGVTTLGVWVIRQDLADRGIGLSSACKCSPASL